MIQDVLQYFRLRREFERAGLFETESLGRISQELRVLISGGHVIAVTAIQGSGKTTALRQIRSDLGRERKVVVSTSLDVNKERVSVTTLMDAIFADLGAGKDSKIPHKGEARARFLRDRVQEVGKPVALFVDEAQDLHHKTLLGLKRLREVIQEGGGTFSVVLIGLPKLMITLRRPAMGEIGTRAKMLTWEGIRGQEREFTDWMLRECVKSGVKPAEVFTEEAITLLATRLTTPLQIVHYGWRTLEEAHDADLKPPIEAEVVESILTPDLDGLEAQIARAGYDEKSLHALLGVPVREIRALLRGRLSPERSQALYDQLLGLGIVA